jgi:hypothetical protein
MPTLIIQKFTSQFPDITFWRNESQISDFWGPAEEENRINIDTRRTSGR